MPGIAHQGLPVCATGAVGSWGRHCFWWAGGGGCTDIFAEKESEVGGTESWGHLEGPPPCEMGLVLAVWGPCTR